MQNADRNGRGGDDQHGRRCSHRALDAAQAYHHHQTDVRCRLNQANVGDAVKRDAERYDAEERSDDETVR